MCSIRVWSNTPFSYTRIPEPFLFAEPVELEVEQERVQPIKQLLDWWGASVASGLPCSQVSLLQVQSIVAGKLHKYRRERKHPLPFLWISTLVILALLAVSFLENVFFFPQWFLNFAWKFFSTKENSELCSIFSETKLFVNFCQFLSNCYFLDALASKLHTFRSSVFPKSNQNISNRSCTLKQFPEEVKFSKSSPEKCKSQGVSHRTRQRSALFLSGPCQGYFQLALFLTLLTSPQMLYMSHVAICGVWQFEPPSLLPSPCPTYPSPQLMLGPSGTAQYLPAPNLIRSCGAQIVLLLFSPCSFNFACNPRLEKMEKITIFMSLWFTG